MDDDVDYFDDEVPEPPRKVRRTHSVIGQPKAGTTLDEYEEQKDLQAYEAVHKPRPKDAVPKFVKLPNKPSKVTLKDFNKFVFGLEAEGWRVRRTASSKSNIGYVTQDFRVSKGMYDYTWMVGYNPVTELVDLVNTDLIELYNDIMLKEERNGKNRPYYSHDPDDFGPTPGSWHDVQGPGDAGE